MTSVGGFSAQQFDPRTSGIQNTGQSASIRDQLAQAGVSLPDSQGIVDSLQANGAPRNAQGVIDPARARNPKMAEKAALLEQFGPQFQATVDSMRKKIELSGQIGNATNNWAKQAEFLVSAFVEGQKFIDQILGQFGGGQIPPEIQSMLDEITRLQDSSIELLNSCLGTDFTKDEFRKLVGAKKADGKGGADGAKDGAQGADGQSGAEGAGGTKDTKAGAEEKLKETVRALMDEARALMAAARGNPVLGPELAGKALQKVKEGLLIIETIQALQKALGGGGQQGNGMSGMDALGAQNIGLQNVGAGSGGGGGLGGGGLGGGIGGGAGGLGGGGGAQPTGLDTGADFGSEMGGLNQQVSDLNAERDELQKLADEAIAMLGGKPGAAQRDSKIDPQKEVPSSLAIAAAPAQNAFGGNLFSGAGATFGMQPLFA